MTDLNSKLIFLTKNKQSGNEYVINLIFAYLYRLNQ